MALTILKRFERELRRLLREVFRNQTESDGYPETTIVNAERSLGIVLPGILRLHYRIAGRHKASRKGLQQLLAPKEIEVDKRGLIFMTDPRAGIYNAITTANLPLVDPPVMQGNNGERTWYLDEGRLSSFLVRTICWQAMELLPAGGRTQIPRSDLRRICSHLRRVDCGFADKDNDMVVFQKGALVACIFPVQGVPKQVHLFVACASDSQLRRFERDSKIEVDWF